MPFMAFFYPVEIAIAVTSIVHLANNLFKFGLFRREVDFSVVFRFGLPAILAAYLGAYTLVWLGKLHPLLEYSLLGKVFYIHPVKLVIGVLLLIFVLLELTNYLNRYEFTAKWLPFGGLLSGFFGGLSGHQGAFRSLFLLKCGLSKERFVATGAMIATMVDITRTIIYGINFSMLRSINPLALILVILFAFSGSFLGKKLLKKTEISVIKVIVAVFLVGFSIGLILGFI